MGCFACNNCSAVYDEQVKGCAFCGSEWIVFEWSGLARRLLINLLYTITKEQLAEMAAITGCPSITHETLFEYLRH